MDYQNIHNGGKFRECGNALVFYAVFIKAL